MGWTSSHDKLVGFIRQESEERPWGARPDLSHKPSAPPRPPSMVSRARFDRLVAEWKRETERLSLLVDKLTHPSYMRIIGLGPAAIPRLLEDLEKGPSHWGLALYAITGENPVSDEDAGNLGRITKAWVAWGRENGY